MVVTLYRAAGSQILAQQVCGRPIGLHGSGESYRWVLLSNEMPSKALCRARSFFGGYRGRCPFLFRINTRVNLLYYPT